PVMRASIYISFVFGVLAFASPIENGAGTLNSIRRRSPYSTVQRRNQTERVDSSTPAEEQEHPVPSDAAQAESATQDVQQTNTTEIDTENADQQLEQEGSDLTAKKQAASTEDDGAKLPEELFAADNSTLPADNSTLAANASSTNAGTGDEASEESEEQDDQQTDGLDNLKQHLSPDSSTHITDFSQGGEHGQGGLAQSSEADDDQPDAQPEEDITLPPSEDKPITEDAPQQAGKDNQGAQGEISQASAEKDTQPPPEAQEVANQVAADDSTQPVGQGTGKT
ncbi:MAG: hypothetical protein Q9174_006874, partial [Haloplaca sp. 1 TL-2023]